MKKSEKISLVKQWMEESPEMEVPALVEKIMVEFDLAEGTAMNYINEASKPEATEENPDKSKAFMEVAKGYESPIKKHWDTLVDPNSKAYAFLEVEQRDFSPINGKKLSVPRVISLNQNDSIQFVGKKSDKKDAAGKPIGGWAIPSQKEAQGLSINAVLHVPKNFGVTFSVDEWE